MSHTHMSNPWVLGHQYVKETDKQPILHLLKIHRYMEFYTINITYFVPTGHPCLCGGLDNYNINTDFENLRDGLPLSENTDFFLILPGHILLKRFIWYLWKGNMALRGTFFCIRRSERTQLYFKWL